MQALFVCALLSVGIVCLLLYLRQIYAAACSLTTRRGNLAKLHDPEYLALIRTRGLPNKLPKAMQQQREEQCVKNLTGASNYWQMIIELRPYLFQCAASIFQVRLNSALFRLPALQQPDVRKWMKEVFPIELKRLQDSEKDPLDLSRIQNEALRLSLEEVRAQLERQNRALAEQSATLSQLLKTVDRRTAVLSPAKGYLGGTGSSQESGTSQSTPLYDSENPFVIHTAFSQPPAPRNPLVDPETRASEDTGVYELDGSGSLRAFVSPSPTRKDVRRPRTTVDLILPPREAFNQTSLVNPVCLALVFTQF
ncbi:hypothetical protein B0H10DRAFT_1964876 [Mycena sp. CBHHK59/15]|nr:hypothetical protein B0H10DRAFT_1974733 [Mycena sp. CBHHK59/15]KAJ6569962.1 hypothetical protein B0H10DRAFT_1964876 [Mycena sp. CBHHK59/15]